ncbi:MAG: lactate utilization protein [Bacillota bacterium]|nr:lactate utilization protein [Bacillota bacterium]
MENHIESKISTVIKNLEHNGFKAQYFPYREDAVKYILNSISSGQTVGIGGSMTIKTLDLPTKIAERGGVVLDHSTAKTPEESQKICLAEGRSDVFLTSTNALTEKGYLVNCDGKGNRVSAMIFGPRRVILVAGKNKICDDVDEAMDRIVNLAAAPNAKRLNLSTPCVETGRCMDCNSPDRICRAYTILKRPSLGMDFTVIIIGENLGF